MRDAPGVEVDGSGGDRLKAVLAVEALAGWGSLEGDGKMVRVGELDAPFYEEGGGTLTTVGWGCAEGGKILECERLFWLI